MLRQELFDRVDILRKDSPAERIRNMRDLLEEAGDEAQKIRHLPDWAAKEMANAGLYRFALPTELAGEDLLARDQIEAVEAASAIDGSVGWCVQINSEINALMIRQMNKELAEKICGDWDVLVCSGQGTPNGPNPGREASLEGSAWNMTYQGSFASGCHSATWTMIFDSNPWEKSPTGAAEASWMVPRDDFEIIDTWDMAGLRGSGSHDVRIQAKIHLEHTLTIDELAPTELWENPTYRNPCHAFYNKAAVALGIARGTIDECVKLATHKTPWGSGSTLKDQPEAYIRLAENEANWMAARAFLMESQEAIEKSLGPLSEGKSLPEWELTRKGVLSATHAAQSCRLIVDTIHNLAGTTGSRMSHPLERKLRDAHQAASHGAISWRHYGNFGKTFLGEDPPGQYTKITRA